MDSRRGATWTRPTLSETLSAFFVANMFGNALVLCAALAWALPARLLLAALAAYYAWVFSSRAHVTGWRWRLGSFHWLRYFDPVVIVEPGLAAGRQYIFAVGPHGIHGFGTGVLMDESSALFAAAPFLRGRLVGLGAWVLFHLPLVREIFLAVGWRDASRAVAERALREGASLYIIVGGELEALLAAPGRDDAVVAGRRRRGFVRLALASGAALVPVYTYRNTDTFATSRACFGARRWLSKACQVCIPLWAGRGGTPLPYNVQLVVAVGAPVPFPRGYAPPSAAGETAAVDDAMLDAYHAAYIAALQKTFEQHKARAGYPPERVLSIHSSD